MTAEAMTRAFWEPKMGEIIDYLCRRGFSSPNAARKCATNFIETMIFVAKETGEPQFEVRYGTNHST